MLAARLAEEVKQRRIAKGLSRKELSLAAQLSETYVSELERGLISFPRVHTLRALAIQLDCSTADLIGEPEQPTTGEIDFPRLRLAYAAAAKLLFNQAALTERDSSLIEMSVEIYDWLAREDQAHRDRPTVDQIAERIILIKPRRS